MTLVQFVSALFGGGLIISACAKLPTRGELGRFLRALGLPAFVSKLLLAFGLTAEIVIGLGLAANVAPRGFASAALALGVAFVAVHVIARSRRVDVSCGCSGFLDVNSASSQEFVRAIVFAALALILAALVLLPSNTPHHATNMTNLFGAFLGGGALLALSNLSYAARALRQTRLALGKALP